MNAAVYVDFENLYLSLKNRYAATGLRTRELSLQILEALLAKLRATGNPIVLGRSYAGFDTYPGVEVAHDLALMGLDPQYVLISHSGKNNADVQLALDVARVLFRRQDIQMIVIVSGDRDFIPLARQVLEEGRDLRVVAIPDTTSGDLRARVGEDRFWNALQWVEARLETQERGAGERSEAAPAQAPAPAGGGGSPPALPSGSAGGAPLAAAAAAATAVAVTPAIEQDLELPAPAPIFPPTAQASTRSNGHAVETLHGPLHGTRDSAPANVIGKVPVTWHVSRSISPEEQEDLLQQCLDLLVRAQIRHNSPDIWLSPFLKGAMSQHFSHLVHPERRALINELRNRGALRVEERENLYAEHPYSVIVIEDSHPMAQSSRARVMRGKI